MGTCSLVDLKIFGEMKLSFDISRNKSFPSMQKTN